MAKFSSRNDPHPRLPGRLLNLPVGGDDHHSLRISDLLQLFLNDLIRGLPVGDKSNGDTPQFLGLGRVERLARIKNNGQPVSGSVSIAAQILQ